MQPFALFASVATHALLAVVSIRLAVVDLRQHRLPNRDLLWSGVASAMLLGLVASSEGQWGRLGIAALTAAGYGFIAWLLWHFAGGGLGAGDVKLAPLIGLYAGWAGGLTGYFTVPLLIGIIGTTAAILAKLRKCEEFAFGPVMLLALWLGIAVQAALRLAG